eukprot:c25634_g1_i1.p1 GENE.c25634_g1_i1~~c25634_g1_i1.p1  ORF type:complete len:268 (-),score=27.78 c25634_g1_i1:361-1164(-)
MGCRGSKPIDHTVASSGKRKERAANRELSQDLTRKLSLDSKHGLIHDFEQEASQWPVRPGWHRQGRHQQGIGIIVVRPRTKDRSNSFQCVQRNSETYTICVGYGEETKFDSSRLRLDINCTTVSMVHCYLHFSRPNGVTRVEIEDAMSLNGTFVLARPPIDSVIRPYMEREVREDRFLLDDVCFIRLGGACTLALDCTNIWWDHDDDAPSDEEPEVTQKYDRVTEMEGMGWYLPHPCSRQVNQLSTVPRKPIEVVEHTSVRRLVVQS